MKPAERTFVALDTRDLNRARELARVLAGRVGGFKIGLEAFVAFGPSLIEDIRGLGHVVFLDLKFHDIPIRSPARPRPRRAWESDFLPSTLWAAP